MTRDASPNPLSPVAVAVYALVLAIYYRGALTAPGGELGDESFYRSALAALDAGRPLGSVPGWYYPDTLARSWHQLAAWSSQRALFVGMRILNLLGTALVMSVAARLWQPRLALALSPALALAPFARSSIESGNVNGWLAGLVTLALVLRVSHVRSGLLAASFLWKPIALPVALARPWREAVVPILVAALCFLDTSGRGALTNLASPGNAALPRALVELGLPVPWQVTTAVVLAAALATARGNTGRALVLGWLALPLAWEHTTIFLVVPAALSGRQILQQNARETERPRALLRLLLWFLALVILSTAKFWSLPGGPRWLSGVLGLVPPTVAALLAWRQPADEDQGAPLLRRSSSSTT